MKIRFQVLTCVLFEEPYTKTIPKTLSKMDMFIKPHNAQRMTHMNSKE